MTYSGFEKKLNKVIYNTLNGHRHFNMDKITTNFDHMLEYDVFSLDIKTNMHYRKVTIV